MIGSELMRIARRRGLFLTAIVLGAAPVAFALAYYLVWDDGPADAGDLLDTIGVLALVPTVMAVLLGALAGSYDTANGIMRYLVMTGVPRLRLYVDRVVGTLLAVLVVNVPAALLLVAGLYALPAPASGAPGAGDVLGAIWELVAQPLVFAIVAVAVGSLLRSNGAAIGVGLVLLLGSTILTAIVETQVSETAAELLLSPAALAVASLDGGRIPLLASAGVLVAWLAAFLALGALRTVRDEY